MIIYPKINIQTHLHPSEEYYLMSRRNALKNEPNQM